MAAIIFLLDLKAKASDAESSTAYEMTNKRYSVTDRIKVKLLKIRTL